MNTKPLEGNATLNARADQHFALKFNPNVGSRADFRRQQNQRVSDSPSLADKFPGLKSLQAKLRFYERRNGKDEGSSEVKYTVNLAHAKSLFQFECRNPECIHGGFDLSNELANAIHGRRRKASGELRCNGWRAKESIDLVRCGKVLSFQLILGY